MRRRSPDLRFRDGDQRGDVIVEHDLSDGLDHYVAEAHRLAARLVVAGPIRATLTFAEPAAAEDLNTLDGHGIVVHTVEAVSEPGASGQRLTVGDEYRDDVWAHIQASAKEFNATMLGVTSAEVTITDAKALGRLLSDSRIFAIDASGEQIRRTHAEASDISVNDLYWTMAGWMDDGP